MPSKAAIDNPRLDSDQATRTEVLVPDTIEQIIVSAKAAILELANDRHVLKQGSQISLSTSALLLGLMLTLVDKFHTTTWPDDQQKMLTLASIFFFLSAFLSLLLQFSFKHTTSHAKPLYLYKKYAFKPLVDMRIEQLANLITEINAYETELPRLNTWANCARGLIVLGILFITITLLFHI